LFLGYELVESFEVLVERDAQESNLPGPELCLKFFE